MLKYCDFVDKVKGLVTIALGDDDAYYESIGMVKRDVEQSDVDNQWYLAPMCPHKTDEEKLKEAKENKYKEALDGADDYLKNEAAYQYDENNSIEATDGNIGKMNAYLTGLQSGMIESVEWTSREDNVLILNLEDVTRILFGIGAVQTDIWCNKFIAYKKKIERARTVRAVNAIVIDYSE